MVVLPMMVENVTMNVTISFKNIKVKREQLDSGSFNMKSSDIVVGKFNLLSLENYENFENDPVAITNFIRRNVGYNQREINSIYITTKKYPNSDFYDIYKIPVPSFSSNKVSDYIYGVMVNNVRNSVPGEVKKDLISLGKVGFNDIFNKDFLGRISKIKTCSFSSETMREQLLKEGYQMELNILDFLNELDYTIDNDDVISTRSVNNVINFFEGSKKESKLLKKFKQTATTNYDCYVALGTFNNMIYNKPLSWPVLSTEQQKILLKKVA